MRILNHACDYGRVRIGETIKLTGISRKTLNEQGQVWPSDFDMLQLSCESPHNHFDPDSTSSTGGGPSPPPRSPY